MIRLIAIVAAAALPLASCKIVEKADDADAVPQDDASRMAAIVSEDWTPRVLPTLSEMAVPATDVLSLARSDFPAAEDRYGIGGSEGAPSNFIVRGGGTVVDADLESRAARLSVDLDGDGTADADLQLGPVIRGTALRDSLPFYVFTDFRDQIEFAKLARALNDTAHAGMPVLPEDAIGRDVSFTGAFTLTDGEAAAEIVPVTLDWSAP
ncbi:DUF2291 domain-containing protein [Roseicyclus sp. F158]|uniref:DUF2291 domain-containing protein n=1 Tax=Tropicimonas omnivorans TaxID=3075590 RepID=A0ABU3DJE8_9RHOB|nr:DUF2291 domain-containing protein [Roseicyclus sp. F158]MDT0683839.1 DUF2291 domain-containing protein [Roseicyclus sp. F158]